MKTSLKGVEGGLAISLSWLLRIRAHSEKKGNYNFHFSSGTRIVSNMKGNTIVLTISNVDCIDYPSNEKIAAFYKRLFEKGV